MQTQGTRRDDTNDWTMQCFPLPPPCGLTMIFLPFLPILGVIYSIWGVWLYSLLVLFSTLWVVGLPASALSCYYLFKGCLLLFPSPLLLPFNFNLCFRGKYPTRFTGWVGLSNISFSFLGISLFLLMFSFSFIHMGCFFFGNWCRHVYGGSGCTTRRSSLRNGLRCECECVFGGWGALLTILSFMYVVYTSFLLFFFLQRAIILRGRCGM